jgi:5-methyltetrahydropteroyltriglutamate--homocysteine methyltransferase
MVSEQIKKLESVGFSFIGIHEPSLMKGISIVGDAVPARIRSLGKMFKQCISVAKDETQIHLDMKYLPFEDYIEYLSSFDADVVILESSRSSWKPLESFISYKHQGGMGLGVFDPDSLRLPVVADVQMGLKKSIRVLDERQIWVTTDVGFRSRSMKDVEVALKTISTVTHEVAKKLP